MLRERSPLNKISLMGVLKRFSTIYIIGDENRKITTEISKKAKGT